MHLQHPHSLQVLSCASLGEDIRIVKLSKESISELGKLSQGQRFCQSVSDLLPCGEYVSDVNDVFISQVSDEVKTEVSHRCASFFSIPLGS